MAAVGLDAVKTVPQKILELGVKALGVSVGFAAGSVLVNTLNAAVPQATIPAGNVTFGVGDAALAIGGVLSAAALHKAGKSVLGGAGGYGDMFIDSSFVGAIGGWAVNKASQVAGRQPVFNNPFPELGGTPTPTPTPAAFTRALYGGVGSNGYLVPSSAYAMNSRAANPVLPIRGAYTVNVS